MLLVACTLLIALTVLAPDSAAAQSFGTFVGDVQTKWLPDGRRMELLTPFKYVDPNGAEWHAPAGAIVDGTSIPQFAWSVIGGPFEGTYRDASVIHDVACQEKTRPWESAHEAFYYAMRAREVGSTKALIMYGAVYHFGPRWPLTLRLPAVPIADMDKIEGDIRTRSDPRSRVEIASAPKRRSWLEILTKQPQKTDLTVSVTPPEQALAEADFETLKDRIAQREASAAGEMSLDEIRNFRPTR